MNINICALLPFTCFCVRVCVNVCMCVRIGVDVGLGLSLGVGVCKLGGGGGMKEWKSNWVLRLLEHHRREIVGLFCRTSSL